MKRILLPFLFLAFPSFAQTNEIWIRHPQADVNYVCPVGFSLDSCIQTACSYATQYSCRIIAQNQNTYFIETYVPPTYRPPIVVVTTPTIVTPPIFWWFGNSVVNQPNHTHTHRHRPSRRR